MTERDRWDLRGPVQSCRLERAWYTTRRTGDLCERVEHGDTAIVDFRRDGRLARHSQHNWNGSEWTATYEYDDSQRLVTVRAHNASGPVDFQRYEYDSAGRLERVIARTEDGRERVAESYEYDDTTGRKQKTLHVDLDLAAKYPNAHYACGAEDSDCAYSAPGTAKLITLYNTHDQPSEVVFHDIAGRMLSRVDFTYDQAGHLLEEAQTPVPELFFPSVTHAELTALLATDGRLMRQVHRYDAQGRRIETRTFLGSLSCGRKTMAYNDHGDRIEEISEDYPGEYSIDDEGRVSPGSDTTSVIGSEARLLHDYDHRGNWIRKTVEVRANAGDDFSVSSTEQRALSYYPTP